LLLLGEAAGLVNPLTGEGIDYALESAEVGAEILTQAVRHSLSPHSTAHNYVRALRQRFLRTFTTISRVRDVYFRAWLLNRAARAAVHHADFRLTLVQVCLGNIDPAQSLSSKTLLQIAFG
jgi:flavin-dependent dehydrogenase